MKPKKKKLITKKGNAYKKRISYDKQLYKSRSAQNLKSPKKINESKLGSDESAEFDDGLPQIKA